MDKSFVELAGCCFPCRTIDGRREISVNGEWLGPDDFINYLAEIGRMDQVIELALLGYSIVREDKQS